MWMARHGRLGVVAVKGQGAWAELPRGVHLGRREVDRIAGVTTWTRVQAARVVR